MIETLRNGDDLREFVVRVRNSPTSPRQWRTPPPPRPRPWATLVPAARDRLARALVIGALALVAFMLVRRAREAARRASDDAMHAEQAHGTEPTAGEDAPPHDERDQVEQDRAAEGKTAGGARHLSSIGGTPPNPRPA
jgi:hypothetical protein